ncbi:MAG: thioredoxin [Anaerovoracaceae bacterium]
MSALKITKDNFQSEVMESDKPVLIDFWAAWCGPCKMVAPIIEEVADELAGTAKVCKINIDEEPELASAFQVMSIPTLAVIKDGKVANVAVGARPKAEIISLLG